jgi:ubiquinone/menaquinone biosynthesis C-methylase UbiE
MKRTVDSGRAFMPAAGRDLFLPLYDPLTRLLGLHKLISRLLAQAALQPDFRVLDVGCGTGAVAVAIKRRHPAVDVVGLDPDPKALARAERKARRAGVAIQFDLGFADALPYDNGTFDRVFSSMMFHHVRKSEREPTLREIRRVLEPRGRLEFLDLSGSGGGAHGFLARALHPPKQLTDNADDRILQLMTAARLAPRKVAETGTIFGTLAFYQADCAA